MMSQWHSCKAQAKEALLLFRLGDFYEAFYEDAQVISKEVGLTLTARQGSPMCGIPFHTADGYIDKLIGKGFKVAVAEQMEDPKQAKGIVKREIVRIITPGTIVNSHLISDKKNNFFVSIAQMEKKFGLALLDITTGEFRAFELEKEQALIDELCRLRPAEMLLPMQFDFLKELSFHFPFMTNIKPSLDAALSFNVLTAHFDVQNLDGFGLKNQNSAISAAGSLLLYLKEELNLNLDHILSIQADSLSQFMNLDAATLRNLEITTSLTDLLDETETPMGARLLRRWIQHPLLSCEEISKRQQKVAEHIANKEISRALALVLKELRDIERLAMKAASGFASPRDLLALGHSLSHLPRIKELLQEGGLFSAKELARKIVSSLSESPPLRPSEGGIFKEGINVELDQLRLLARDGVSWMARYQSELKEKTGLKTLKVGYTRAFGYYIELSRAQGEVVPAGFQRKQTLTNAERFITEELKQFEHQVLSAEERAKALEVELFELLRKEVAREVGPILAASKIIAEADLLLSLAKVASQNGWICPTVDTSDVIEIMQGRHPIVERSIGKASFIPNDTALSMQRQLILITGPNMAGKSTYIRQVAVIVVLAHIGSFVPAQSARIGIVDKIFSRIGASDDLARGQSTFMVEMAETANILNNATARSLVLLDEIGRGTSTYDGISIAWAVAEYLLTTAKRQAKCLFATHYWELTRLEEQFPHALNFHTEVQETSSGIAFLHKIVRGGTDKSYGIHVAKLAGIPVKALKRAEEMLKELENASETQLALFDTAPHPLTLALKQLDLSTLSPLQALVTLHEWKRLV